MKINYLYNYKDSEPVNRVLHQKKRKIRVVFNERFFDKIELDVAIESLPANEKAVIVCNFILCMSQKEISQVLQIHRNTVRNRLLHGIQLLRDFA